MIDLYTPPEIIATYTDITAVNATYFGCSRDMPTFYQFTAFCHNKNHSAIMRGEY